jgi:hypothetical protein
MGQRVNELSGRAWAMEVASWTALIVAITTGVSQVIVSVAVLARVLRTESTVRRLKREQKRRFAMLLENALHAPITGPVVLPQPEALDPLKDPVRSERPDPRIVVFPPGQHPDAGPTGK